MDGSGLFRWGFGRGCSSVFPKTRVELGRRNEISARLLYGTIPVTLLCRRIFVERLLPYRLNRQVSFSHLPTMIPSANLPKTMKAGQGKDYGDIDEMISVEDNVAVPTLASLPESKRKTKMLIKVLAVSLSPGDCRVLSGKTRTFQGPPSFPYVPAGDCCGIVQELPEEGAAENLPFTIGDRVAVRFDGANYGAMGEYALVSTRVADKVPQSMSSDEAAALASATPATVVADRIQPGERVLVLGAGGGVGSHFCQLLRHKGASYVVGTSRSPERLLKAPISVDKAIDYTQEDVWTMQEFIDEPFDAVVDFALGHWPRLVDNYNQGKPLIVKPNSEGGRYITTSPDAATYEIPAIWKMLEIFLFPALWRAAISRTWYRSSLPGYSFAMALPEGRDVMTRTMALAKDNKIRAVMDPQGPFPFTTEGVRKAYRLQESRHIHGKVIVHVADN